MDGFLLTAESGRGSPSGEIVGWQTDGDGDLQDLKGESPQAKMNLFKGKKLRSRAGPDSTEGAIVPLRAGSGSHNNNRSVSRESSKKSVGREGSVDSLASSASGIKKIAPPNAQLPGRAPWSSGAPTAEEGFGGMVEGRSASPTLINIDEANNLITKMPKDGQGGPITPLPPADGREGAEDGAAVETGLDQAAVVDAQGCESGKDGDGADEGAGTADDQGMAAADPVVVYEFASGSSLEAAVAARMAGKGSQGKVNRDPSWVDVRDSSFRSDVTFSHYSPKRGRAAKLPSRETSWKDIKEKSTQQTRPIRCVSPWHPSLDPGPDLSLITAPSRASPGSIGPAHGFNDRAPGLPSNSIRRVSIESLGDLNPRVPLSPLGAQASALRDRDAGGHGIGTFDRPGTGLGGSDDGGSGAWSPMPYRAGRANSLSRSLSSLSLGGGGGGGAVSRGSSRPTTHDLSVAGISSRPVTSQGDVSGGGGGHGEEGGDGVGGGEAMGGVSQSMSFEDLDFDFQAQAQQAANLSSPVPTNSRLNTPMTRGTYLPPASALAPGASGPVAAALRALAEKKKIKSLSTEPRPRTMQRPPGELLTAGTSIGVGGAPPRVYSPSLKKRAAAQEEERSRAREAAALASQRKWREQDEEGEGRRRTAGKWAGGRVRLVGDNNPRVMSPLSRWESSSAMWSPLNSDVRAMVKQGGGNTDPLLEMSFTLWSPLNMGASEVDGGLGVGDEARISSNIIKGLGSSGSRRESEVAVGGLVGGPKEGEEGGGKGAVAQEEDAKLQVKENIRRGNVEEMEMDETSRMLAGRSGGKGGRGDRDGAGGISSDAARGMREEAPRGKTSDASSGSVRGVGWGLERARGGKVGSMEAGGGDQQIRGAQSIAKRRSPPVSRVQTAPSSSTLSSPSAPFKTRPGFGLERGKSRDLGGVSSPGAKGVAASLSRKSPIPVKLRGVAALEEPSWWQIEGFDPMSELGAEGLGWGGQQVASERRRATLKLQRSLDTIHKVNVRFLDLPMDQHANVPLP